MFHGHRNVTKMLFAWPVFASLLTACATNSHVDETAAQATPQPRAFFAGRWAPDAMACRGASWLVTEDGLQTPGHVTCRFEQLQQTPRGAEADAVCVAEGPPRRWTIRFAYAESARALLIEDAPFADAGLVACEEAVPGRVADALSENGVSAANAVQAYFELLAAGRADEARRFRITDDGNDELAQQLAGRESRDIAAGPAGRVEGAAGSLYVNVPVSVRGEGGAADRFGNVTLRRSNNVPGATAEQRSWRIVRIDWQKPAGE